MFFNRQKKIEQGISEGSSQNFWSVVRRRFRKDKMALWASRLIMALAFVAVFGDFIANEKPIYCRIAGESHWPIFKSYLVNAGVSKWDSQFLQSDWQEHPYEVVFYPPIPYSPYSQDRQNSGYLSPFAKQDIESNRFRHWLGTDQIGRDVMAGMIHGTRIALSVGIVAMFVAALIGISLGALAGYFGDEQIRISRARLFFNLLGASLAVFFGFISRSYELAEGGGSSWLISWGIILGVMILVNLPIKWLNRIPVLGHRFSLPVDLLIMRLIEIVNSIPGLLLILALLALVTSPSIYTVMIIIGLIAWTNIARFVRAELLRIRSLAYIESAKALGLQEWQIMLRHALPNALTPILISIAFGIAGAILLEAFLSFIGLGIPLDQVSWGSMLNEARLQFTAWWLAIFPGIAIFLTVLSFNLVGEGLIQAMDRKG